MREKVVVSTPTMIAMEGRSAALLDSCAAMGDGAGAVV